MLDAFLDQALTFPVNTPGVLPIDTGIHNDGLHAADGSRQCAEMPEILRPTRF
jgi:hypothetical protein